MKYQQGQIGRVFVARVEHGEDLLQEVKQLAEKENVRVLFKTKQKSAVCGAEIASGEYWAVNTPQGVKVIHGECFKNMQIDGCHAQV
ncbi:MAG: hypothetical protein ACOY4Q_07360 [Bacillota bacterium]